MELIVAGSLILLLLLVVGIVWFVRSKNHRDHMEQIREICYLLDRVSEAAAKRKTQLYQSLDGQDNQVLIALQEAATDAPVDISAELKEIDALWLKLSQQVGEFSTQSVQSTLRSTVVTSQAAQVATQIAKLVDDTKEKLGG